MKNEAHLLAGYSSSAEVSMSKLASVLKQKTNSKAIILTIGSEGCAGFDDEGYWEIPGISIDAVDTTGAGRCFYRCNDMCIKVRAVPTVKQQKWANYVAALSVTKKGSFPSYSGRKEVEKFIISVNQSE